MFLQKLSHFFPIHAISILFHRFCKGFAIVLVQAHKLISFSAYFIFVGKDSHFIGVLLRDALSCNFSKRACVFRRHASVNDKCGGRRAEAAEESHTQEAERLAMSHGGTPYSREHRKSLQVHENNAATTQKKYASQEIF